jgi:RNA polymerase sigma factor (sigma-70 family)
MRKNDEQKLEDWAEPVARSVVKRFLASHPNLKGNDEEDLVQECLIHWFLHRDSYDPTRGASARTYMSVIVERRLGEIADAAYAQMRSGEQFARSLDERVGDGESGSRLGDTLADESLIDELGHSVQLEEALSSLSPLQRRIVEGYLDETTVVDLAEELGKSRSTIYEELKRIRRVFQDKGLVPDGFLGEEPDTS